MAVRLKSFSLKFQIAEEDGQNVPDPKTVASALDGVKKAMDTLESVNKPVSRSPTTSSSEVSLSDVSISNIVLLLNFKCYLYYLDFNGNIYKEKVEFELTSETTLASVLQYAINKIKIRPKNGEFCGVLYTGSAKAKKLRLIIKKDSEMHPIGKLASIDSTDIQLYLDCIGKLRRKHWNRHNLEGYEMFTYKV